MKKIILMIAAILMLLMGAGCKSTSDTSSHIENDTEDNKILNLTREETAEMLKESAPEAYNFLKRSGRLDGLGFKCGSYFIFPGTINAVTIFPNPTTSSVRVEILKNIIYETEPVIGYGGSKFLQESIIEKCFPIAVTLKLIFDNKIIWDYHNPSSNGVETIDEKVLQNAGNYQLVVEVDEFNAIANFIVLKKN